VDGARQGLPVAVVAHRMTLSNYDPLPLIKGFADWERFVCSILDPTLSDDLVERASRFASGNLLPEGADRRILQDMLECASNQRSATG
jgi:hypothetical protein